MALIAIAKHPNGTVIEYREAKGIAMMEQRWPDGTKYIVPRASLKGLLADIRYIGGQTSEFEAQGR